MADPFPAFTDFLQSILLYLIYIGVIMSAISGVYAGILFLPIFNMSTQRSATALRALQFTGVGLLIILLAIPARNVLIARFPPPAGVPAIPLSSPAPNPTPKLPR